MSTQPEIQAVMLSGGHPETQEDARTRVEKLGLDIEWPEFDDGTLKEEYRMVGHWECGWEDGVSELEVQVVEPLLDEIERLRAELKTLRPA